MSSASLIIVVHHGTSSVSLDEAQPSQASSSTLSQANRGPQHAQQLDDDRWSTVGEVLVVSFRNVARKCLAKIDVLIWEIYGPQSDLRSSLRVPEKGGCKAERCVSGGSHITKAYKGCRSVLSAEYVQMGACFIPGVVAWWHCTDEAHTDASADSGLFRYLNLTPRDVMKPDGSDHHLRLGSRDSKQ